MEEAEAEACLEGVRLTAEWVRQPAHVEADCSTLIDALNSKRPSRASWAGILAEIQKAGILLPGCIFGKVKREGNQIAHILAQQEMREKEFVVKCFNFLSSVSTLVESEMPARSGDPCDGRGPAHRS
ncbi:hypothetical protein PR202_gb03501 [Eleusine coracana subsp. coracana]|uniref:RNase H type-1 domain-containing protein n=1 Tax=Eleusine coracana subsp. coracana TaxID=191504 RepID=A0AAV5E1C3_ELECO|nr:hypothetical protein PR202_gb03501 [Eleusine coracana subsp. coracana]